jgi:hypothetical protein
VTSEVYKWILIAVKEETDKVRGGKGKEKRTLTNTVGIIALSVSIGFFDWFIRKDQL